MALLYQPKSTDFVMIYVYGRYSLVGLLGNVALGIVIIVIMVRDALVLCSLL